MGKGTIMGGGDDGQYTVQVNYLRINVEADISTLDGRMEALQDQIDAMDAGADKNLATLKKAALGKRKEFLQNTANIPADPTVSAWCADLTEDLSGEVGTIEVPGEQGTVQIQPGYGDNAEYNQTRDGQMQPIAAADPYAAFYNLAMLPGWQKWKPTYRHGMISDIDTGEDTCTVTLEAATSSQQSLAVNQGSVLVGVPIDYMDCNSAAFEDGDSVLVEFTGQDYGSPKVIGFKDNPKACKIYIQIELNGNAATKSHRARLVDGDGNVLSYKTSDAAGVFEFSGITAAEAYLDLWFLSGSWDEATADENQLFTFYREVEDGEIYRQLKVETTDWVNCGGAYQTEETNTSLRVDTYYQGLDPGEYPVARMDPVQYRRHMTSIWDIASEEIETAEGATVRGRKIDFDNLKIFKRHRNRILAGEESTDYPPMFNQNMPDWPYPNAAYPYPAYTCSGGTCTGWKDVTHTLTCSSPNNLAILSDEYGCNPSYAGATMGSNYDPIFYWPDPDPHYLDIEEYTYSMISTPTDRF